MNKKIYCVGGATIDYKLKSLDNLELFTSNPVTSNTTFGGVAFNVALNLANLTNNVYLQCAVGNDTEGRQLLSYISNKSINIRHSVILDNNKTSRYYAVLDQSGEIHMGLADMEIYNHLSQETFTLPWDKWKNNSIIFLDTNLPNDILEKIIRFCAENSLLLCIDPVSTVKAKKLPSSFDGVFLIKPDKYEAAVLANMSITSISDCFSAGNKLLKKGAQHVVISLGKAGYVIVDHSQQMHFPAIMPEYIVDVSGAGDAFIAGILYELSQGSCMIQACETGAAAASLTLQSLHTVNENMSYKQIIHQKNRNKNLVNLHSDKIEWS